MAGAEVEMSGNYSTVGKSWPRIQEAHIRAVMASEPPKCRYHVGLRMVRIQTEERCTMTSGNVSHISLNFRCPALGCVCVSGQTTEEEQND
jgi:hypothetical protein